MEWIVSNPDLWDHDDDDGEQFHHTWLRESKRPRTAKELFNRCHSSARSIVERTFGVVKARFRILTAMRPYSYKKQRSIV